MPVIYLLIYVRQFGALTLINFYFLIEITRQFGTKKLGEERKSLPYMKILIYQKTFMKEHLNSNHVVLCIALKFL